MKTLPSLRRLKSRCPIYLLRVPFIRSNMDVNFLVRCDTPFERIMSLGHLGIERNRKPNENLLILFGSGSSFIILIQSYIKVRGELLCETHKG
jgi:hypothetical protein